MGDLIGEIEKGEPMTRQEANLIKARIKNSVPDNAIRIPIKKVNAIIDSFIKEEIHLEISRTICPNCGHAELHEWKIIKQLK